MTSVLSRPWEPQLEGPLQSFHALTLGTTHNHAEFIWNVAPVWGRVTHSLHYILKGFCNPKRTQTSHLVPSPHCRGRDRTWRHTGRSGRHWEADVDSRPTWNLASACMRWRPPSNGCFSASGDLGWACGKAGCDWHFAAPLLGCQTGEKCRA